MSSNCFSEECGFGVRAPEDQGYMVREICDLLIEQIAEAGGAGLLEGTLCPHLAMRELAPKETDAPNTAEWKLAMCGRLGIVGFGNPDSLD